MSFCFPLAIAIPILAAGAIPFLERIAPRLAARLGVAAGLLTAGCALALIPQVGKESLYAFSWIPGMVRVGLYPGALGVYLAALAAVVGSLCLLYLGEEEGRHHALMLLFIGAAVAALLLDNFLARYFALELVAISACLLMAQGDFKTALRSYFIIRLGDVGFLAGMLLLFRGTGSFNIQYVIGRGGDIPPSLLTPAAACFLLATAVKAAQFPFHVWLLGTTAAPTPAGALVQAVMPGLGLYLLLRVWPLFAGLAWWGEAVLWVGALSALLAAAVALAQDDLRRLWAYSTVSQFGVMVFALAAGAPFAAQVHLLGHVLPRALLSLSGGRSHPTPAAYGGFPSPLPNLGEGRGRRGGRRALAPLPGALVLLGLTLLSGFWSKEAVLARQHPALVAVEVALVLTFAYALPACRLRGSEATEIKPQQLIPLFVLAAGALASLLGVGPLVRWLSCRLGASEEGLPEAWALVRYFLTSPAVLLSLLVVPMGFLLFARHRVVFEALGEQTGLKVLPLVRRGFSLEALYPRLGNSLLATADLLWRYFEVGVLDRFNYLVAGGMTRLAGLLLRYFDVGVLDRFNYLTARGAMRLGRTFRRAHTGYLGHNLWWVVGSFVVLLLLLAGFLSR